MQNNGDEQKKELTSAEILQYAIFIDLFKTQLSKRLFQRLKPSFALLISQIDTSNPQNIIINRELEALIRNDIKTTLNSFYSQSSIDTQKLDAKFKNVKPATVQLTQNELLEFANMSTQQSNIIIDTLLKDYIDITSKVNSSFDELTFAQSPSELKNMQGYKNLTNSDKLLINKAIGQDYFTKANTLKELRSRYIKEGINERTATSLANTSVFEASSVVETARYNKAQAEGVARKEWVSILDNRTRPSHARADGQTRLMNEPFQVGNPHSGAIENMMRPRDMSLGASLSNVVKCRCTVIYL
jgi:hypothetical protein